MSLINNHPEPSGKAPKYDSNIIKWSGYFATSKQAEEHLKTQTESIAYTEDKLVVSSKMDFVNRHFKGYFLYRFTVVLTEKN
jgi:hypothetical protein